LGKWWAIFSIGFMPFLLKFANVIKLKLNCKDAQKSIATLWGWLEEKTFIFFQSIGVFLSLTFFIHLFILTFFLSLLFLQSLYFLLKIVYNTKTFFTFWKLRRLIMAKPDHVFELHFTTSNYYYLNVIPSCNVHLQKLRPCLPG